jgi:integrase
MSTRRGNIKRRKLKRDPKPRWDVTVYAGRDAAGKKRYRRKRGLLSLADAEATLATMIAEIDAARPAASGTLAAFLDAWLTSRQTHVRPSTLAAYRWTLGRYLTPVLGDVALSDLKPEHLTSLYASLTIAPKSIRNLHGVIRRALRDAVAWGHVQRNVAALVQPPALRRPEIVAWSPEQLRAFLDHVRDDRFYPAWLLFATTGMRRGEVAGLRWTDIDGDRLHVRAPRVVVSGHAQTSEPKTRAGRRTVSLDPGTVEALATIPRRSEYVFTWPDGRPVSPELWTRWLREHAAAAGLPRIRLHDLRHSYASLALSAGIPLHVVSARLGHSSPNITLGIYSHALPAQDADAANLIAALLRSR